MSGATLTEPYGLGRGFQQPVRGDNPAAGQPFSQQQEGRYVSRLLSAVFTLTTSAVVANRYVTLEYLGGDGLPFCVNGAAVLVTANSVQRFTAALTPRVDEWNTGTDVYFPLAPVFLEGGVVVKIAVAAMDAGDQLSGIRFLMERFPTSPAALPADDQATLAQRTGLARVLA